MAQQSDSILTESGLVEDTGKTGHAKDEKGKKVRLSKSIVRDSRTVTSKGPSGKPKSASISRKPTYNGPRKSQRIGEHNGKPARSFHCDVQPVKADAGTACIDYMAGLGDHADRGDIEHVEGDLEELRSVAEAAAKEARIKNGPKAENILKKEVFEFPEGATSEQREQILKDHVQKWRDKGHAAAGAVHVKNDGSGAHGHIVISYRKIIRNNGTFTLDKTARSGAVYDKSALFRERKEVADLINKHCPQCENFFPGKDKKMDKPGIKGREPYRRVPEGAYYRGERRARDPAEVAKAEARHEANRVAAEARRAGWAAEKAAKREARMARMMLEVARQEARNARIAERDQQRKAAAEKRAEAKGDVSPTMLLILGEIAEKAGIDPAAIPESEYLRKRLFAITRTKTKDRAPLIEALRAEYEPPGGPERTADAAPAAATVAAPEPTQAAPAAPVEARKVPISDAQRVRFAAERAAREAEFAREQEARRAARAAPPETVAAVAPPPAPAKKRHPWASSSAAVIAARASAPPAGPPLEEVAPGGGIISREDRERTITVMPDEAGGRGRVDPFPDISRDRGAAIPTAAPPPPPASPAEPEQEDERQREREQPDLGDRWDWDAEDYEHERDRRAARAAIPIPEPVPVAPPPPAPAPEPAPVVQGQVQVARTSGANTAEGIVAQAAEFGRRMKKWGGPELQAHHHATRGWLRGATEISVERMRARAAEGYMADELARRGLRALPLEPRPQAQAGAGKAKGGRGE